MDIKVDELEENEDGIKGGKITIITETHTITIDSQHVDDAYYLASNLEDCANKIEVKQECEKCYRCDGKGVGLDWGAMHFWECDVCGGTGELDSEEN
ncbi:transcriptional regulator [Bacillus thuringiensis]|uniref:transcriptional regulator n=1 Tax=Bacillus thuringiensis TaxID=1428 RepID=UPI0026E2AE4D|nr:transcriptional regulator [Bacillus thuringiensis]MDO6632899.1 transcriptional regulator [Bacillus thuringiensis]MDO6662196.1 transcriptional regulator [Bacillus thuringiensis]MDO6700936.1 transcriptional regulator [Bacillus thuringiensis]